MLKRKSLTALILLLISAFIAGLLGIQGAKASAETSAGAAVEFEYEDETEKVITGIKSPADAENIVIPEGVTAIGKNAFKDTAVKNVTLNKGLLTIDDYAFTGTAIASINVPDTVIKIGEHAFNGCANLTEVVFSKPEVMIEIAPFAFYNCKGLRILNLPDNAIIRQFAFDGCNSLLWVYVGENSRFHNSAGEDLPDAAFFPLNTSLTIVFPSEKAYKNMLNQSESTFKNNNAQSATYIVKINCFIGADEEPVVYERLHGRSFDYVPNKNTGLWNDDTAYSSLPVQDATYSATTWYSEKTLKTAVNYDKVNELLGTESEINLYCHETISVPSFPAEPVSWVYKKDISYDINDISQVLKALGCEQQFTGGQLQAFDYAVSFADEKGNAAELPESISGNGVYSVRFSLKPEFGSWAQDITSSVTVNVNTNGFTTVMIVLLVIGVLAVVVTVSTAVIRKKVQARNKKKQLSQKEILEKFKANGGETTLT